ncbi:hypothetical protein Bca52824_016823 [Brassica carinata]|uniref:Uncharacterized protein n=1 Tax=Brassica carinata TaxID=52824 RepID=A0A8X7W751_BRACI|nr:hypothetical protein Bca52824_016823 [Brassica carinata]
MEELQAAEKMRRATLPVSRPKLLRRRETIMSFASKQRRGRSPETLTSLFYSDGELLGFWASREILQRTHGQNLWILRSMDTVLAILRTSGFLSDKTYGEFSRIWKPGGLVFVCTNSKGKTRRIRGPVAVNEVLVRRRESRKQVVRVCYQYQALIRLTLSIKYNKRPKPKSYTICQPKYRAQKNTPNNWIQTQTFKPTDHRHPVSLLFSRSEPATSYHRETLRRTMDASYRPHLDGFLNQMDQSPERDLIYRRLNPHQRESHRVTPHLLTSSNKLFQHRIPKPNPHRYHQKRKNQNLRKQI